jgi:protein MpaA
MDRDAVAFPSPTGEELTPAGAGGRAVGVGVRPYRAGIAVLAGLAVLTGFAGCSAPGAGHAAATNPTSPAPASSRPAPASSTVTPASVSPGSPASPAPPPASAAVASPPGNVTRASPAPSVAAGPGLVPAIPGTPVETITIGTSVDGRPITATELGDPAAARTLVVVGCVHGNEPAGIAIARRLESLQPPAGTNVWVIEDLNPDGVAAGTRQNAHGVDLNRNFPYLWANLGPPGSQQYSGTGPLSEPESAAAAAFLQRVRPSVSIWFHQPLDLVDLSGGDPAIEERYAALVGLPFQQLTRYPGSALGWENHTFPGTTAFVVELPAGTLSPASADRYARAALTLISS